jgi:cyclic pyranopterin phosphate synthase
MSVKIVDVSKKPIVYREAIAEGIIRLRPETIKRIKGGKIEKGDPVSIAKIAAILAAKQTPSLIPLTHPIPITGVDVDVNVLEDGVKVRVSVRTTYKTGCEIDALVAASIALLTIFDVVKKYEKDEKGEYPTMLIDQIKIIRKRKMS